MRQIPGAAFSAIRHFCFSDGNFACIQFLKELKMSNSLKTFEYQLLGRLQQDCKYYLGAGARNTKHLWALDVSLQIEKMKELYEKIPIKPEWLTMDEIKTYEYQMIDSPGNTEQPRG